MTQNQNQSVIYRFLLQSITANGDNSKFPKNTITLQFEDSQNEDPPKKGNAFPIPIPPYKISDNFQILIYLASIFGPFISNKDHRDLTKEESSLIKWLYFYKVNYPHMPNLYDLILTLSLNPEQTIVDQNPSTFRFIIHKFCELFSKQTEMKIKEFSMSIPINPVLKNIEADMIVFVPIITPISAFSLNYSKDFFDFPEKITVGFPQNIETNGNAFSTNDSPNSNTDNPNSNSNANVTTNGSDNPKPDDTFVFYAGLFESSQNPSKYVLIKIGNDFYKYDCCNNFYDNDLSSDENINKTKDENINSYDDRYVPRDAKFCVQKVIPKNLRDDFCVSAFFLRDNSTYHPFLYQKIYIE